ncbi:MAG: FlgD immunoglobulin-like domain containing protein [Candidatus Eisenbacteria bacterium]
MSLLCSGHAARRCPSVRLAVALALAVVASATLLVVAPAAAATAWILRFTDGYDLIPNPPNNVTATTFVLTGTAPYPCPRVSAARVVDPGHVELTVSPGACGDSATAAWRQTFDLGLLPVGNHDLSIHLTFERPDSATVDEQASFTFGVVDGSYHEPPPDTTRGNGPLIAWGVPDPAQPRTDQPTALVVHGFFPFDCGRMTGVRVVDPGHVEATALQGSCGDTTRVYDQRFELGLLPAGHQVVDLTLTVSGDTSFVAHGIFGFDVIDPNAPPPPPVDSLKAVMSASRPNPFREQSSFSISLDGPAPVEVAVFDLGGRRVRTVYSGMLPRGTTQLAWDGHRADGSAAPGGIYFYRLTMPDRVVTRRVVLLSHP